MDDGLGGNSGECYLTGQVKLSEKKIGLKTGF